MPTAKAPTTSPNTQAIHRRVPTARRGCFARGGSGGQMLPARAAAANNATAASSEKATGAHSAGRAKSLAEWAMATSTVRKEMLATRNNSAIAKGSPRTSRAAAIRRGMVYRPWPLGAGLGTVELSAFDPVDADGFGWSGPCGLRACWSRSSAADRLISARRACIS